MDKRAQVDAVQKMQDYIETHLNEEITLYRLARETQYSPWYCARLFKELTGKTPFAYIREYRLSKAALALRDCGSRVIDVAMDFVFDSHEGFTRAFHRHFGVSPREYKRNTPPLYLFRPWPIRDSYSWIQEEKTERPPLSAAFSVQIRNFPARKLLLKRGRGADDYFSYCEEAGCEVWGLLCSVKEALYEPVGLWLPACLRPANTSRYAQGVEVPLTYRGAVPEGFELICLPACRMMLFQGRPYDEARFEEAITGLSGQIDRYDPRAHGYEWADEEAPRIQLEPQGWRGYIEARPVKEILS